MGGNKAIAAGVLIVVILGAVIIIIRQQRDAATIPDHVLQREVALITAEQPFEEKTYRYGDIMNTPIDQDTGYRRIGGKLWATPMECASSVQDGQPHKIPVPPRPVRPAPTPEEAEGEEYPEEDEMFEPYPCPICGREANPEIVDPAMY